MKELAALRIALIGGGNMARALIGGLLGRGALANQVMVAEPDDASRAELVRLFNVRTTADNNAAVSGADVVVLAVKPQLIAPVARALAPALQAARPLVISVAAGIESRHLQSWLGNGIPVVRAMPNRPALIGAGATGLYAAANLPAALRTRAQQVVESTGLTVWVQDERDIDLVTALSGSGPAYFFRLAEIMADVAIAQGLDPAVARQLAAQTLAGAGQLVAAEKTPDLARMRAEVASKGGTTEAALAAFTAQGLEHAVAQAMQAAAQRSRELAQQFGNTP
jgi:pyrroline-5-carboxylate reductase